MMTRVDEIIEDRIRSEAINRGRGVAVARVTEQSLEELTFVSLENWRKDPLMGFENDVKFLHIVEDYDIQKQYVVIIAKQVGKYAEMQAYIRRYRDKTTVTQSG